MVNKTKKINWIDKTPLGICAYSVKSLSTQLYEDVIEIIMCMRGSVDLYCAYEKYRLIEGDFITTDRDVYFLDGGEDCMCVSLFIDFNYLSMKYPDLRESMFVCDGRAGSTLTDAHLELQSLVLGLISYFNGTSDEYKGSPQDIKTITMVADKIIKCMVDNFDILYYRVPREAFNEKYIERYHRMSIYLNEHLTDQITLKELADEFRLTEAYVSEFIRRSGLSFKKIMAYIRANKSEKMLLTTDKSITEISAECGFSDVTLYYSAFKEWYHCTPRQFRERYKYGTKDDLSYIGLKGIEGDVMRISLQNHRKKLLL